MRRAVIKGLVIGVNFAPHCYDFAGHRIGKALPHATVQPAVRQVEDEIPNGLAAHQLLQQGRQFGPDAGKRLKTGKQRKESLVSHRGKAYAGLAR